MKESWMDGWMNERRLDGWMKGLLQLAVTLCSKHGLLFPPGERSCRALMNLHVRLRPRKAPCSHLPFSRALQAGAMQTGHSRQVQCRPPPCRLRRLLHARFANGGQRRLAAAGRDVWRTHMRSAVLQGSLFRRAWVGRGRNFGGPVLRPASIQHAVDTTSLKRCHHTPATAKHPFALSHAVPETAARHLPSTPHHRRRTREKPHHLRHGAQHRGPGRQQYVGLASSVPVAIALNCARRRTLHPWRARYANRASRRPPAAHP